MTISVANRLYQRSGLSERGQLVLAFIDGGRQWVDWAMGDAQMRYAFADEAALLAGVQTGLHGGDLILLPRTGVLVGANKLMGTSTADLRLLARAEASIGTAPSDSDVAAVLARNAILTPVEMAAGDALLARLKVGGAPVFQRLTLEDRLALAALAGDAEAAPPAAGMLEEAAAFGVAQARTPLEFADYTRAYHAVAAAAGAPPTQPARTSRMQLALDTLLPLTFGALDCPSVTGLVAPIEVRAAVADWSLAGRMLGFARASLAFQQIVAHAGYAGETGAPAQALVRDYYARTQALLNDPDLGPGQLGQDGASCRFEVRAATGDAATIALAPDGTIAITRFVPAKAG